MRAATVLLALLVLAGCARAEGGTAAPDPRVMPADFAGTVEYVEGSVAPPYHYEWQLRFDESSAVVDWRPGYDEATPAWRESVEISEDQRTRLYGTLHDLGVFAVTEQADDGADGLVGGPTGTVELTAGGRTYDPVALGRDEESADLLVAVHDAVRELVPAEVWDGLADRQQAWGERLPK